MSHMVKQVHKGDGWIIETSDGSVVVVDYDAPAIDRLRTQIGERVWIEDICGTLESVTYVRGWFGRYSAPGYLDCTSWEYDTNRRRLERTLRDLYSDEEC